MAGADLCLTVTASLSNAPRLGKWTTKLEKSVWFEDGADEDSPRAFGHPELI